ncbi:MAG: thermonuclease family protein [Clostridia bacterium]|nr:thermonuclease family protein [Clostridia bacterium]
MRFLCILLCLMLPCAAVAEAPAEHVDYAGQLGLNPNGTVVCEASVKTFVDGDTTHFYVPASVHPDGVFKARYLAINTPETTGKVEEWGKKAAAFTREKLTGADSIILQSEDETWNLDSTGERHLVWVWYRTAGESVYRCLNLEILQNGLARANATASNRYGGVCQAALNQAKAEKLNLYSGQKDPDFYYGDAIEMTLRELRLSVDAYAGKKVAFNGVVTLNDGQSVYVEAHDPDTGLYFGMPVYYGFNLSGAGLDILSVGNEVRIVGTLQFYEAGGTWQVSGLSYRPMKPTDPGNIQKLSSGHSAAYPPVAAENFAGSIVIDGQNYPFAETALGTTIEVAGLTVMSGTASEDGSMTLVCTAQGAEITVRTNPLYDQGALITPDRYIGQTVVVRGVVEFHDGGYQIRALLPGHITLH